MLLVACNSHARKLLCVHNDCKPPRQTTGQSQQLISSLVVLLEVLPGGVKAALVCSVSVLSNKASSSGLVLVKTQ